MRRGRPREEEARRDLGALDAVDGSVDLVLLLDPRAIPTRINVVQNWFEELKAKVPPR